MRRKRRRPNSPALWITPDMSAETWAGAAAWARGSQVCIGKNAALSAKATTSKTKTASRRSPGWASAGANAAKSIDRVWLCRSMKAATSTNSPTWVDTR
jgi:hypothetical protein